MSEDPPTQWGRGRHSPRVLPSAAVRMESLPDWHRVSLKLSRDSKRRAAEAEKDGVEITPIEQFEPNAEVNKKITFWRGDITTLGGDAIVNAANSSLLGGGGIDGAIHAAAGIELYKECAALNGCNRGQAKITKGYRLPVKHVIHTVGPVGENPKMLATCYESCLAYTNSHHIRTIALCGISTGIYGYPPEKAAHVALMTVRRWLERAKNASKVDRIVFVTYTKRESKIYEYLAPVYFPPALGLDDTDGDDDGQFEDQQLDGQGDADEEEEEGEDLQELDAPSTLTQEQKPASTATDQQRQQQPPISVLMTIVPPSVRKEGSGEKPVQQPQQPKAADGEVHAESKAEKRRRLRQEKKAAAKALGLTTSPPQDASSPPVSPPAGPVLPPLDVKPPDVVPQAKEPEEKAAEKKEQEASPVKTANSAAATATATATKERSPRSKPSQPQGNAAVSRSPSKKK